MNETINNQEMCNNARMQQIMSNQVNSDESEAHSKKNMPLDNRFIDIFKQKLSSADSDLWLIVTTLCIVYGVHVFSKCKVNIQSPSGTVFSLNKDDKEDV